MLGIVSIGGCAGRFDASFAMAGIGCILFGVLFGGLSLNVTHGGAGPLLLVANTLSLVGRNNFKDWLASRDRPRRSPGCRAKSSGAPDGRERRGIGGVANFRSRMGFPPL